MSRSALFVTLFVLTACGTTQGGSAADTGALVDVTDAADVLPADASDIIDVSDVADVADILDVVQPDALDSADAPTETADLVDSPDTTAPKMCFQPADCGPGTSCVSPPCKNCGAKPSGLCLPPVATQGCWFYPDCGSGVCHGANPFAGSQGFCLPKPEVAGGCWPDSASALPQCYPGSSCDGGNICPPMGACPTLSKPGTCSAAAEHKGKVFLWARNGSLVAPGETVVATWVNGTDKSIFLGGCGTYLGETTQDGKTWTQAGSGIVCVWEGIAQEVPPGGYRDVETWTSPAGTMNGTFRLHGQWFTGCTPGQPVSQGGCSAPNEAMSEVFSVGLAP